VKSDQNREGRKRAFTHFAIVVVAVVVVLLARFLVLLFLRSKFGFFFSDLMYFFIRE
jgi:hypothetical protein